MLKKIVIVSSTAMAFYSCGKKDSANSGSTPTPTAPIYAGAGPSICSGGIIANRETISPYFANFQEALASPFKTKTISQTEPHNSNFNANKGILKIVGGDPASAPTTKCQPTATASRNQASTASTNTVAIYTPSTTLSGGRICTGELVASNLVITAAHCFNNQYNTSGNFVQTYDLTDRTAMGAVVVLDNAFTPNTTAPNYGASNYSTVKCWQRNPNWRSSAATPQETSNDYSMNLSDIAWIQLDTPLTGSTSVALLANQATISTTEEKLMAGFGKNSERATRVTGEKDCTSTYADTNYSGRGDIVQTNAPSTYNAIVSSKLGISSAYGNYISVIGPINGGSPHGTCYGDSGGPVYVYRNSNWVLAAIVEGSDALLSSHPTTNFSSYNTAASILSTSFDFNVTAANCDDGYGTYTLVSPYISWIQSSSGVTLSTQ